MKKVFIIHGFQGSPNGGWRPWLMGELEKQEIYACALSMPNPDHPVVAEWSAEIDHYVARDTQDELYLVGHSLGVPSILKYLEKTKATNIKGLVLVSGPILPLDREEIAEFLQGPFDYKAIKAKVGKVAVIHGDNDDRVPHDHAVLLAKELDATLITIPNGGHLNGSSGWVKLPQCLEVLEGMMK